MPEVRVLEAGLLPHRVRDLPAPPARLYLVGELPGGPAVAIVGTRDPTTEAARFTEHLAGALAREGVTILSGGASGIDSAAHLGALDAGGVTVVVAPSGFERPFPSENRDLFRRVVEHGGAYLTAEAPDAPAASSKFFPRNSYLVALADVVVVVEAPFRSGARNAAKWARRLGRKLFVVPGVPWNPRSHGCVLELRLGAEPLLTPRDVLRALADQRLHGLGPRGEGVVADAPDAPAPDPRWPSRARPPPRGQARSPARAREAGPAAAGLQIAASDLDRVRLAVVEGASHPDAIAGKTGLPLPQVQRLVLTLVLDGVLVPDPSGRVRYVR